MEKKGMAYKAGYIFGATIWTCISAIAVALTVKLIMWMF